MLDRPLRSRRLLAAALIFLVTLSISLFSVSHKRQLGQMDGMAEEYFDLGIFLALTHHFPVIENTPFVFRPPGYSFFIASVFTIWGGLSEEEKRLRNSKEQKIEIDIADAVVVLLVAQCLLLGLSAMFFFLWLSSFLSLPIAIGFAFAFGCNPYAIILTGFFHYALLHIFLLIVSSYALSGALANSRPVGLYLFGAGILWGVSALVRPVVLILPIFTFFIFLYRFKPAWMSIVKSTLVFTIGMGVTIAPYTLRNYALTERFIPVNAQAGAVFWAATVAKSERDPNHFRWWHIWNRNGMPIFQRITKRATFSHLAYLVHNLEFEDEFAKQTTQNLRRQPQVFAYNFVQNVLTFNLDINSVLIKVFQSIQDPSRKIDKQWFAVGHQQNFHDSLVANAFSLFVYLLTLLSVLGIYRALRDGDPALLVPGFVYLCLCVAHAITVMDLLHYYIKIPFLFVFAAYFVDRMGATSITLPAVGSKFPLSSILNAVVISFGVGLSLAVL